LEADVVVVLGDERAGVLTVKPELRVRVHLWGLIGLRQEHPRLGDLKEEVGRLGDDIPFPCGHAARVNPYEQRQ
jgi:hypothetical protein